MIITKSSAIISYRYNKKKSPCDDKFILEFYEDYSWFFSLKYIKPVL